MSKNIFQRINAVMQDVAYIKKDKSVNGGGQSYKAVTHDNVVAAVRSSMVKNGIVVMPVQTKGEFLQMRDLNLPVPLKMGLYSGWYDVFFVNIDDPNDKTCVTVEAHANDNGDKAPGKAMTYAVKTAILKQFTFETGEDDESRAELADVDFISDEQQRELFELLCSPDGMYTNKGLRVAKACKFNNLSDIKSKQFEKVKAMALK